MNKLAILVVTYNRKELLKENMAAIFNQNPVRNLIIIYVIMRVQMVRKAL